MKKAGGIISLIAGVFGTIAAGFTLLFGGMAAAFEAEGGTTVVALGWGGVLFSFLVIIFGAMTISAKNKTPAIGTIVCSVLGIFLGGGLVALFMVLSAIGGILGLIGLNRD